jgi:hypothetical protein
MRGPPCSRGYSIHIPTESKGHAREELDGDLGKKDRFLDTSRTTRDAKIGNGPLRR